MRRNYLFAILLAAATACPSGCGGGECDDDEDCDDGLFCNGHETCQNSTCMGGRPPNCDDNNEATDDSCDESIRGCRHLCLDQDGDGHFSDTCDGDDCDDGDEGIYPGAPERCNGLDDDCDTVVEEDMDGDGFYNDEGVCTDLDPADVDCDDTNRGVYPGAPEPCNERDDNCVDGIDDEADTDGDGHVEIDCASSPGGDDCDDEDGGVHPGADEVCNGIDDDCVMGCDDGFDCCMAEVVACDTVCGTIGSGACTPACLIPVEDDCIPPVEICNGEDDDCDDVVDNDLPCAAGEIAECETICGTIGTGICTDECRPAPPDACNPPAEECNGVDDDCNELVDETFPCDLGSVVDCETTCGTSSTALCTGDCQLPGASACTPATELDCMDFEDNDCDGDEDCLDEDCFLDPWCG